MTTTSLLNTDNTEFVEQSPNPTLDIDFAELTGYKEENPTFSDSEISALHKPENNRTVSTLTNSPYAKMALVGGIGGLGFGVAGFVMSSLFFTPSPPTKPPVVDMDKNNILKPNIADQKDLEIQRFKTDLALGNQTRSNLPLSSDLPTNRNLPLVNPNKISSSLTSQKNPVSPLPSPTYSQTPVISSPPTAFNNSFSPSRLTSRPISVSPEIIPVVNPQEQWQNLASLGSYGTTSDSLKSNISPDPAPTPNRSNISQNFVTTPNRPVIAQNPFSTLNRPNQNPPTTISQANVPIDPSITNVFRGINNNKLSLGTTGNASIKTPVVFSTLGNATPKFIAILDEPMLASDNTTVVIPAGAFLIVTAQLLDPKSGLAELNVVSISVNGNETTIPSNVLVIRGSEGSPLIADNFGDSGGTAGSDVTSFLVSAAAEVGRVINNPTSSTVNSSVGSFSSSTVSPSPDIGGAILSGGFSFLSKALAQRNEDARKASATRSSVFYVPSGKKVQVFVNQTINL